MKPFPKIRPLYAFTLAVALLAIPGRASANIIFDNGLAPSGGSVNLWNGYLGDDFSFASAQSIDGISFEYVTTDNSFDGTLNYAFYSDNAGLPGDLLGSGLISGLSYTVGSYSELDFAIPAVTLAPGSYWLGLEEDSSTAFYWARVASNGTAAAGNHSGASWGAFDAEFGFQLTGTPASAPEPSAFWLIAAGAAVLPLIRRLNSTAVATTP